MLRLAWLPIAQHVFQPALTGRLELISRKNWLLRTGTKAFAVTRFREKLSPANWMQGVTAIWRKISRSWAPRLQNSRNRLAKRWGPTCDRDISNSAIYTTAIYQEYTVHQNSEKLGHILERHFAHLAVLHINSNLNLLRKINPTFWVHFMMVKIHSSRHYQFIAFENANYYAFKSLWPWWCHMACSWAFGTKSSHEPMLIVNWTCRNKLEWN